MPTRDIFRRRVVLTFGPIDWWYRHRDRFQILPPEPEAPKLPGKGPHQPALLELALHDVPTEASTPTLDDRTEPKSIPWETIAGDAEVREAQHACWLLSLLTWRRFGLGTGGAGWFVPDEPAKVPRSVFGQLRYRYPEFQRECDGFSDPGEVRPIRQVAATEYRRQGGYNPIDDDSFPDDLDDMLDRAYALTGHAGAPFYRALALFNQSSDVFPVSQTMAFAALVSALETLAAEFPGRPTARFRAFVERFSGVPQQEANHLYDVRSRILHDGVLRLADDAVHTPWHQRHAIGGPAPLDQFVPFQQQHQHQQLRSITRACLISWLAAQP